MGYLDKSVNTAGITLLPPKRRNRLDALHSHYSDSLSLSLESVTVLNDVFLLRRCLLIENPSRAMRKSEGCSLLDRDERSASEPWFSPNSVIQPHHARSGQADPYLVTRHNIKDPCRYSNI
jgi:hypothetical protein